MNVLSVGTSDSVGGQLAPGDRQYAWPLLLQAGLAAGRPGEAIELFSHSFYPLGGNVLPRLDQLIENSSPDLVCLSLSWYAFSVRTVKSKVRERWGSRVLDVAKRVEANFDRLTLHRGEALRRVNSSGRGIAKHVIGTAPMTSYQATVDGYREVMRRISQLESVPVIVLGNDGPVARLQPPWLKPYLRQFRADSIAMCEQFHFTWLDGESSHAGEVREDRFLPDGIHRNLHGHRKLGEAVVDVALAALQPAPW